ncbi:hypothetical protein L7F22_033750 [Adiantum nelumboides]|nr:hypothetical protein [Adiantum nelumboides]
MGLGRLFSKTHKRKRTLVSHNTTPLISCEQEADSPFSNLQDSSTDLASAAASAPTESTDASSPQHEDWYYRVRENDGDLDCHKDDDNDDDDYDPSGHDDDERLSCISNVDGSAFRWQNTLTYYGDHHGSAVGSNVNHEDSINFEEEQGVSMELDIDSAPQYLHSTSSPDSGFLHSSGRPTLQQACDADTEALYGTKKRTIDSEFEEYFASLLLK